MTKHSHSIGFFSSSAQKPVCTSISIADATSDWVDFNYDIALDPANVPANTVFTISGKTNVGAPVIAGNTISQQVTARFYWGDIATGAYTKPAAPNPVIKSTLGGEADSFTATAVTNNIALDSRAATLIASYGTVPTNATKALINKTIVDLKAIGTFAKRDVIILPVHTSNDSLFNLVSASFTGTLMNAPTFTPGYGWALNGTTQYLKSNYVPSTNGITWTLNSASFTIIFNSNAVKTNFEISGAWSTGSLKITEIRRPNGYYEYYNGGLNGGSSYNASTDRLTGIFTLTRTASNVIKMFVNKILKYDKTNSSTALTEYEICIGCANAIGVPIYFENDSIAGYALGGGLSQTEVEQETDILQYYRDNIIATL